MTVETIDISPTLRVRIEHDPDAPNPRTEYDNVGTIVYTSGRYVLGDERISADAMGELLGDIRAGRLIGIPVYAYIHSGTVLKASWTNPFSCPWDSGMCGLIYCTPEKAQEEWGSEADPTAAALKYLAGEVNTYSSYLAGECHGYVVERVYLDDEGEETHTEELNSCWGFLGDIGYVRQEATDIAKSFAEAEATPA